MQGPHSTARLDEFLLAAIDSVPQLESLLLLWSSRPRVWSAQEIAAALYIETSPAQDVLDTLARRGLVCRDAEQPACFCYAARSEQQNELVAELEREYKRNLIRITRLIHSKASNSVRQFADAFRFKKEPSA